MSNKLALECKGQFLRNAHSPQKPNHIPTLNAGKPQKLLPTKNLTYKFHRVTFDCAASAR